MQPTLLADGKQFIAELDVGPDSPLIGETAHAGMFPSLAEVTVRLVQRGEHPLLPPFEEVTLQAGDILIVAATRKVLTDMLAQYHGHLLNPPAGERRAQPRGQREMMLAEAMVRPGSRIIGQTLEFTNLPARSHCIVLGIQRRARMLRTRLGELRLQPGDVLLLLGLSDDIERLRGDPDILVMEWSASEMPLVRKAPLAALIFAAVVAPAALDLVPIVVTALLGVLALVLTGCLNVRQAARAVDRQIVLIIASSLALGTALEATGAAAYLARLVLLAMDGRPAGLDPLGPVPADRDADQRPDQQRGRGAVHAGRGQPRAPARRRRLPLRARGGVRRQLLVRDPDRLPDQPLGHGTGALPLPRLRGRRPAAGASAVAGVLAVRALVLRGMIG